MYNELEIQNDEQVGAMTEKVKMLKSVSLIDMLEQRGCIANGR